LCARRPPGMGSLILGSVAVPDLAYHPRMGASTPSSRCKQVITKRREHTWLLPIKCDADLRFGGSFAHGAARKRRLQRAPVEATPDDDDAAGGVLAILPRAARRDLVQLVHRLGCAVKVAARRGRQYAKQRGATKQEGGASCPRRQVALNGCCLGTRGPHDSRVAAKRVKKHDHCGVHPSSTRVDCLR